MGIIKFPGEFDPQDKVDIQKQLEDYRAILSYLDIDPTTVRSKAQLDALLANADEEAKKMLAGLPPNHPLNQVNDSIEGYMQHRDEARARKDLEVALNRASMRLAPCMPVNKLPEAGSSTDTPPASSILKP
ncbi:MAG: hypothetical protein K8I04_05525 [Gammaproteobacteria bacterium]|nr:hypothetical protein [Gammaproteobacteria bacterium]